MLCNKILGKVSDDIFKKLEVDYVDIEWHEAFSRLHRKVSHNGTDVGIRMDHDILQRGLRQDDVLYADGKTVIAVNIPPCEAICAVVSHDHPQQIAKLCYEIGNTHTSLFRGDDEYTFYAPYHQALMDKINQIQGVCATKTIIKFDFEEALSSSINNHHH